VGVEVAARSAVRGEQRVELALASPLVMEVRMPHLDRDRKATRQRGEVAVEPRQVACAEVGTKLEQQRLRRSGSSAMRSRNSAVSRSAPSSFASWVTLRGNLNEKRKPRGVSAHQRRTVASVGRP
jgi:hypothetical protein